MDVKSNVNDNLIVVDTFKELNDLQKKQFLASVNQNSTERQKYADILIKNLGSGVYNKLREKFCNQTYRDKILDDLKKKGITAISVKDERFPENLAQIPNPPLVLYCKGNLSLLNERLFAVVGSRKTGAAALASCRDMCGQLAENFVIVTGVAEGADTAAAEGAVESGRVICVLPNGLDHCYPAASASLIKRVEKSGLLISEFTPPTPVYKHHFFLRNRIIAGLVDGVLIVSAAARSGALMTANYAAEYGREVFALPYNPGISSGEGCNALIKNGASLCDRVEDILTAYNISAKERVKESLTEEESAIYSLLKEQGEIHLEKIASAVGKPAYEAAMILSSLEIKGLAARTGGNKYSPVK